jgi:hypothetical protein
VDKITAPVGAFLSQVNADDVSGNGKNTVKLFNDNGDLEYEVRFKDSNVSSVTKVNGNVYNLIQDAEKVTDAVEDIMGSHFSKAEVK